jgi:hypothetical protein
MLEGYFLNGRTPAFDGLHVRPVSHSDRYYTNKPNEEKLYNSTRDLTSLFI